MHVSSMLTRVCFRLKTAPYASYALLPMSLLITYTDAGTTVVVKIHAATCT